MTMFSLDWRIFGNGRGFKSPHFDDRFYWLNGEFYTFMAGHGAQLHSVQWTHPNAGEERVLCGLRFRPLHSSRRWGRVMVAWACQDLPKGLDEANYALRQIERYIGSVTPLCLNDLYPAQGMKTRQGGDGTAPSRSDDSPVVADDAPHKGSHPIQKDPAIDLL